MLAVMESPCSGLSLPDVGESPKALGSFQFFLFEAVILRLGLARRWRVAGHSMPCSLVGPAVRKASSAQARSAFGCVFWLPALAPLVGFRLVFLLASSLAVGEFVGKSCGLSAQRPQ